MSGFYDSQPPSAGVGQTQLQPFQQPMQPQYQPGTHQVLPPPALPHNTTESQASNLPSDPVHVSQVPFDQTAPNASGGLLACPRCSYNNHPSMTQCEVCEAELAPAMPPRPSPLPPPESAPPVDGKIPKPMSDPAGYGPPPQRLRQTWGEDDPANPVHYTRDPHKLVAYIIPLPTPTLASAPTKDVPRRFLIYTPPPPPLKKPSADVKEERLHMVQRKWQDEVRKAKTSTEKTTSFKGLHHKMVRGTNKAMGLTTSANLDFLGRAQSSPGSSRSTTPERRHGDDGVEVPRESEQTVPVDEMCFIYPESMGTNEAALREEFINTLMRTKSKAQRDSVIATGLVPVGFGIDFLLVVVGGLGEIATVWAFKSIMGAKTARSISKRLASAEANQGQEGQLKLSFKPSPRIEILRDYLEAKCNRIEPGMFPRHGQYHVPPTEGQIIDAIGWSPHQSGGETKNWEDEQWELSEVKEDFRITIHKGAKEWRKWCSNYERDWEKQQKEQRSERSEAKYANQ